MQDQANGQKRELVTWAVAIVTLINAFMVWLAASGDYPQHETAVHETAPAHGEATPLGDVEPEHAAAPGHVSPLAGPGGATATAPHGVELRPMADPGGLPQALEKNQPGH